MDAQVYGISTDFPFALAAFASSLNVDFPLLSDCNKEASASYEVLFEEALGMKGVAKRSAVVVSKDGEVIYSESSDDLGQFPDFDAIKSSLGFIDYLVLRKTPIQGLSSFFIHRLSAGAPLTAPITFRPN